MAESSNSIINEAKWLNSSMRRTKQSISNSLMQSDHASQMLSRDSDSIKSSLDTHKYQLKTVLKSTKANLSRLKSSQEREKLYLQLSILLFALVVIYIVIKRLSIVSLIYGLIGK